jgi:hypothetical protein
MEHFRNAKRNVETIAIEMWLTGPDGPELRRLVVPIPLGSGPVAQAAVIRGMQEHFFGPLGQSPFDQKTDEVVEKQLGDWKIRTGAPASGLVLPG